MSKKCKYCGKTLHRRVFASSMKTEKPSEFKKRVYCNTICSTKGIAQRRLEAKAKSQRASDLVKDEVFTGRINSAVKKIMKENGVSPQKVVDSYVNRNFKVYGKNKVKERK